MRPTIRPVIARSLLALTLLAGVVPFAARAQTAAATTKEPAPAPAANDALELSPFEVRGARDDSYGVLNSNSLTSFNADLGKLPISADVFTSAFMDDTNSTTMENMLREFSAGAGTGSAAGDVGGIPVNQPMDRGGGDSVSAGVQLRGLGAAVVKQDSFMLPSPAGTGLISNFGVERIEVINGPQALLYGNGGGGGVVNIISKQARFNRPATGALKLQINDESNTLAQFDYSVGTRKLGLTLSLLRQELGDNRDWIGGPLEGAYLQVAAKVLGNTVVRVTGKQTDLDRVTQRGLTVNAGSAAADARHGQNVRYLLASGQLEASATGASGAGAIANGHITWDNVDSYAGEMGGEVTKARLGSFVADTVWTPWLSTQISAGYQSKESRIRYGSGFTFYAPNAAANPLPGEWSMAGGGGTGSTFSNQPSRSKSFRFSALLTNTLFSGRAHSQTLIGADFTQGNYANENFGYYQADADFNVIRAANGTRTLMPAPNPFWSVHNGPVKNPFSWAGAERMTYNGVNYVAQIMNETDPALVSPQNPQGVTGDDLLIHSEAISRGLYAVNFTDWHDGRLTTLLGMRYVSAKNVQLPSTAIPAIRAEVENLSFSVGANYALTPEIRPYVAISDTYNLPGVLLTVPADPLGRPAAISHSLGEEIGVKLGKESGRISGSIALFAVQAEDDPYAIPAQLRDSINAPGINGRHLGATGTVINVTRKSYGLQVALTGRPTRNWRMRLSAGFVRGTIGTDTSYDTLYNDQFYANAQGQVTYADGTVVHVRPTFLAAPGTAANAGYIPLTIQALSTPGNAYYANPDPISGRILASNGRTVLLRVHPVHGAIRTGVTGVPISQFQLTGVTPVATIVTSRSGDRTTGYPEFSLNFTNMYTVSSGRLKGFRIGGTANFTWRLADYYYYPTGYSPVAEREIFMRPTLVKFDAIVGYERRFKKVTWSTQVNVTNLFDDYKVLIRPNNIAGFSGVNNALWNTQPRAYTWTNTIKF
jgi:outer membrane receptor protein involved in Fe transport